MGVFSIITWFVTYVTVLLNIYIYTYPNVNPQQCNWSYQSKELKYPFTQSLVDIPYLGERIEFYLPKVAVEQNVDDIKLLAFGDPQINGNWDSTPYIKRLDNFGNDHYLGHIYKTMRNRLEPTHVAVLGDLFSSQWILDSEFFNRTRRYVTRLFDLPQKDKQHVLDAHSKHEDIDWMAFLENKTHTPLEEFKFDFHDVYDWTNSSATSYNGSPLFINVSGNHDIGYSGDATWQHMARYHELFGLDNYYIEYAKNTSHAWRIVVLNSLTLEGPALQEEFVEYTWEFLRQVNEANFNGTTVLLTHVPFYKEEGLCVDGPEHIYYGEDARESYKIGLLRSHNHLAFDTTQKVLEILFGNGKPGIVMTGHDHEGCENYYTKNAETGEWYATKDALADTNVREITVRAMMGEYDGNSGIMTGHFNEEEENWEFDFNLCPFMIQHVWWASKVLSLLTVLLQSVLYMLS